LKSQDTVETNCYSTDLKLIPRTKTIDSRLALAKRVALMSDHQDHRHGAVIVKGGSVISVGCNKLDFSHHAALNRSYTEYGIATLHAEISALHGLSKERTRGCTLYVVRLGKRNDEFRLSAPCDMCMSAMARAGIKKIIYTVDEERIAVTTPGEG